MQNENSFKQRLLRNSYLLITAAWLVTISFIIDNYWSGSSSPEAFQKKISSYIAKQENDFDAIAGDSSLINKIAKRKYNEALLKQLSEKEYFLFIFSENNNGFYDLLFWNTQVIDPTIQIFNMVGKSGFIQLANGNYVWRKNEINSLTVLALIPIKWNYAVTNEYLKNSYAIGNGLENNYTITSKANENSIRSKEGTFLFSLEQKAVITVPQNTVMASVLRILAVMVIFLLVHIMATYVVHKNFYGGVFFLIGFVLLIRITSYYLPLPLNLRQFNLFNPNIYSSTPVLRSLGDLLINALLFLWIILFVRHYIRKKCQNNVAKAAN